MQDRQPTPADCLEGARLGVANATSLLLASSHLRRRGFAREAVLLLATAIEEAAKAGVLHRAWMVGDQPPLFQKVIDGWRTMTSGRGAHQRKHASAPYLGSTNFTVVLIAGILADLLSKERSGSGTSKALDAIFGSAPPPPIAPPPPLGWYARLWDERQAVYVDWQNGEWSDPRGEAAAFFDEGRANFLPILRVLRSDIGRAR